MSNDEKDYFQEAISKWAESYRSIEESGKEHSFSENLGYLADRHRSVEETEKNRTDEENLGYLADQSRSIEERGCRDISKNINEIANRYRDIDEQDTSCNRKVDGKTINDHFTPIGDYNDRSSNFYYEKYDGPNIFVVVFWIFVVFFAVIFLISTVFSRIYNGNIEEYPYTAERLIHLAEIFNVTIDYDADIADKLTEARVIYANDNSKSTNSQKFPSHKRGINQVKIKLVSNYLLTEYTLDEIPSAIDQLGYRSATINEIIFLGIQYKNQIISIQEGNAIYLLAQESNTLHPTDGDIQYCSLYYEVISGNIYSAVGYLSEYSIRGCGGKLPSVLFAVVKK